jgi:hypothetical protein
MKFKYSYRSPQIDLVSYKKELDKTMRELLALGLASWLEAVIAEVPLWSGASRATFLKVASEIGYPVPVGGGPAPLDRIGIGQSASTGELVADIESGLYTFTYGTSLPWLIWNEYHNANFEPDPTLFGRLKNPGPYNFQVKGAAAFVHATGDASLPLVAPYVRSKRVR